MSVPRCRFYLQGNCQYGSSCRFLHSDDRGGHRSNSQYHDEYRSHNNRHGNQSHYGNDQYERYHYHSGGRGDNYQSRSRGENNRYGDRSDNYQYGERGDNYQSGGKGGKYQSDDRSDNYQSGGRGDNYHSKKNSSNKNNYDQRNNYYEDDYYSSDKYDDDYSSVNKYQSKKNYNAVNYYKDNDFGESRNNIHDHKYNNTSNHFNKNNQEKFTNNAYKSHPSNRYNDSEHQFMVKHNQTNADDRYRKQKFYENEIETYRTQINQLIESNMWPLTCCHPIGSIFALQPVGCLNFLDVSFEEIRCDYYIAKSVCANPEVIHKQTTDELLRKALKLKTDVVALKGSALDDLIATFEKCEQSKTNKAFVNSIQADKNSYWDMSIRELKKSQKSEIDSFSFVTKTDNSKSKSTPTLNILMQNEIYGKMDCEAFAQENFTDFIPIMPPPRKYCV